MKLNIAIILGTVREQRNSLRVGKFLQTAVQQAGHTPILIDPVEYDLPLLNKRYSDYEQPPAKLQELREKLVQADAYITVTAEYNHSLPPALTNLLDHFKAEEYNKKPSGICCYSVGSFGGVRAAEKLRQLLPVLGTPTIPTIFPIPQVDKAINEGGSLADTAYERRVKRFLEELVWYGQALKAKREAL